MVEPLTDAQLVAIEDRGRAALLHAVGATEAPWTVDSHRNDGITRVAFVHATAAERVVCTAEGNAGDGVQERRDLEFVAHARAAVPQLTEDVARLLHEVRRLRRIEAAARACLAADETHIRAPESAAECATQIRELNRARHALRCALPIEKVSRD